MSNLLLYILTSVVWSERLFCPQKFSPELPQEGKSALTAEESSALTAVAMMTRLHRGQRADHAAVTQPGCTDTGWIHSWARCEDTETYI